MAAQMLAAEQGISGIDALVKLIKSPVYDAIYDLETGMWREGPSGILEALSSTSERGTLICLIWLRKTFINTDATPCP